MLQKLKRISLVFVVFLSSCSTNRFLYDRINLLIPWYLGSYVDFSEEQKDYLDEILLDYLDWHRSSEMPFYLTILDTSESLILTKKQIRKEDIAKIIILIDNAWFRLEQGSMEWVLIIAKELSSQQIDNFIKEMRVKAEEYKNEKVSRTNKNYQRDLKERIDEGFKKYMGNLNPEQKEIIVNASSSLKRSDRVWLNKRIELIDELEKILKRDVGWERELLNIIALKGNPLSQGYSDIYSHNFNVFHEMISAVLNIRSNKQEKMLLRQISKYKSDIQNIIK